MKGLLSSSSLEMEMMSTGRFKGHISRNLQRGSQVLVNLMCRRLVNAARPVWR